MAYATSAQLVHDPDVARNCALCGAACVSKLTIIYLMVPLHTEKAQLALFLSMNKSRVVTISGCSFNMGRSSIHYITRNFFEFWQPHLFVLGPYQQNVTRNFVVEGVGVGRRIRIQFVFFSLIVPKFVRPKSYAFFSRSSQIRICK